MHEDELKISLTELEKDLTERLRHLNDFQIYWKEVDSIISDLKSVGHDLWSHDYDGESKHLWGWDYMRMDTAGFLQIQFDFQGEVTVFWRSINPQLGATSED